MGRTYNPLKMRGSWIGFFLALICLPFGGWIILIAIGLCKGEFCSNSSVFSFLLIPLIGFLAGWGLHCLARKLREI